MSKDSQKKSQNSKKSSKTSHNDSILDNLDDYFDNRSGNLDYVHIRIQQRNNKKCLTTIQGIDEKYDLKRIVKVMKKEFNCNGSVVKDKDVIILQGDQRENSKVMLTTIGLAELSQIKVHGA